MKKNKKIRLSCFYGKHYGEIENEMKELERNIHLLKCQTSHIFTRARKLNNEIVNNYFQEAGYSEHYYHTDYEEYKNLLPFPEYAKGKNIIFRNDMVYCPSTLSPREIKAIYEKLKSKGLCD